MGGLCSTHKDIQVPDTVPEGAPVDAGRVEQYGFNEIKEIKVTKTFSVLVSQFEGNFYAYGSKCPHNGANLATGVLLDGLVKCPWHGACFDIRNGDIEDYPGTDAIPTYPISRDELGKLTVYPIKFGHYKVHRPMAKVRYPGDMYIILGAGAAGIIGAQALREAGFDGRIVMISDDKYLPYDRTKLSKNPGIEYSKCKLRTDEWYRQAEVEVILNARVATLDVEEQEVKLEGYSTAIEYHKILITTGMRPRLPPSTRTGMFGTDLKNVFTLYDIQDGRMIKERCAGKVVVVMGAGFIAMELLAPLCSIAKRIYVVHRSRRPYGVVLGDTIGRMVQQYLLRKHKNKIGFISCDSIKAIFGNLKREVVKVLTMKRRKIKCSVVIFAMGGVPNTDFIVPYKPAPESVGFKLPRAGIDYEPALGMNGGYIPVSEHMETHLKNHYAAGDIVNFPTRVSVSNHAQLGHWGMAQKMGRVAGSNMGGKQESIFNTIPFFWTTVAGLTIRYVGYGEHYNHTVIFGDIHALKFCVLYKRAWKTVAACTCNCDPIAARLSFDLQDNIHYEKKKFPKYITDVFPLPPITGDTIFGLKYFYEEEVNEFDLTAHFLNHTRVPRKPKNFRKIECKDKEYIEKPLMTLGEKLYHRRIKYFPRGGKAYRKMMEMKDYDPVKLNFQRLALYKDTRLRFARHFALRAIYRMKQGPPIFWE